MQIDWLTVAAQIVNFLILVWLLHRVLYRPLNRAIEARGLEVNRRLAEAEEARQAAADAERRHQEAIRDLEQQREAALQAAREEADALRHEMTEKAHAEIAARRAAWQEQLDEEKAAFLDRLRQRAGAAFVALARRVLSDMADRDLIDQIARVFARRIAGLDEGELAPLQEALGRGETPEVLSSFPLSSEAQATVTAALAEALGDKATEPRFRRVAEIDNGIVLAIGSRHVGWTIGEHLDAFEQDVAEVLRNAEAAVSQR